MQNLTFSQYLWKKVMYLKIMHPGVFLTSLEVILIVMEGF